VIAVRLLSPQRTFSPPRVAPYLKADSAKAVVTYSPEIK
jgi:hypothetical protein